MPIGLPQAPRNNRERLKRQSASSAPSAPSAVCDRRIAAIGNEPIAQRSGRNGGYTLVKIEDRQTPACRVSSPTNR
jgi:hypothetical protein